MEMKGTGIMQYVAFHVWLLLLRMMFSSFIHITACVRIYFIRMNNIPLYEYHIHHFMDTCIISTFWLLWIMLLWTYMYKLLCRCTFSILLNVYLGIEFLGHMVILGLAFWGTARLFYKATAPIYIPTSNVQRV